MGGHSDGLRGGSRSVPVDRQNPDRVFGELVESIHLVVESADLHTLKTEQGLKQIQSASVPRAEPVQMLTCSFPDGLSVHSSL